MKRSKILSIVFATIFLLAASAQAQLRYGFNVGGSFAKASLSDVPGWVVDNGSGFRGGMTLEYQMPRNGLAFDVSVLYERYSYKLFSVEGQKRLPCRDFVNIPLNVKYKFWLPFTKNLAAPMIFTGPDLMIGVGSKLFDGFKTDRLQPGWNVGVGIDAANILQLSAGYRFGLGNAFSNFYDAKSGKLTTSGWFVSASILFDF